MQRLLTLAIDGQQVAVPDGIPTGGLPIFVVIAGRGIEIALGLISVLTLIFIIISGIKWITAGGDKTKIQSARGTLTYAIIGFILALLSFFIVTFISKMVIGESILDFPMDITPRECGHGQPC